jgi:hypothetical protein
MTKKYYFACLEVSDALCLCEAGDWVREKPKVVRDAAEFQNGHRTMSSSGCVVLPNQSAIKSAHKYMCHILNHDSLSIPIIP